MPLSEVYQYLESNFQFLHHINSISEIVDSKVQKPLSLQENLELDIEKSTFTNQQSDYFIT